MAHEIREKCDVFRHYMFVCYRAFLYDHQQLQPMTFYNIISRRCMLTVRVDMKREKQGVIFICLC